MRRGGQKRTEIDAGPNNGRRFAPGGIAWDAETSLVGWVDGFRRGKARGSGMGAPVIGAVVLLAGVVAWLARSRQAAVRRAEIAEQEAGRLRAEKRAAEVRAVKEARRKRG